MKRIILMIVSLLGSAVVLLDITPGTAETIVSATQPTTASTTTFTAPTTKAVDLKRVLVRDTALQHATTRAVVDGAYLVPAEVPMKWTLQFEFASEPGSVRFTIDGHQPHVENYAPWVVEGDNNPINLPLGDHVITYAVDQGAATSFHLSILPAPMTGTNLEGISYPQGDPAIHPQLLVTAADLHVQMARFWIEGSWNRKLPGNYFHVTQAWEKAGYQVSAVANYQNSEPRCSAPPDSVWTAYWNAFPTSTQTGIAEIDLGNEVNTAAYYNGSPEQLAHLLELAYPILHAKGYIVCAPSVLNSLSWYHALQKLNAYAWCDRIDVHSYAGSADAVVACIDQGIAFGRLIQKPCDVSEWGVRMPANNKSAWALETARVYQMLQGRSGWFSAFSFYPTGDLLDQATPLDAAYHPNEPFHAAIKAAVLQRGN